MIKKVLCVSIFLLALGLPAWAQEQQQRQGQTAPASTGEAARPAENPEAAGGPQGTKTDAPAASEASGPADPGVKSAQESAGRQGPDYYKIGLAHYESKKFKDAVEAFKRALRLKPADADIHYNLGLAYYSSNLYKEAAESYKQAARLRPDWADAHFRLGWMYYILGKKDSSFEQYRILQKLSPEQAATLYRIIKTEPPKESADAKPATATRTSLQPDAKEEPKVESRLVVSDFNRPTAPAASADPVTTPDKDAPGGSNNTGSNSLGSNNVAPGITTAPADSSNRSGDSTASPAKTEVSKSDGSASTAATSTATASTAPASSASTSSAASSKDEAATRPPEGPAPVDEASLVKTYRVGVGDVLDIRMANSPTTRSTLYTVMEGGLIEYPLAGGPMSVSGLTIDEINARLSAELKRRAVNQGPNELVVSMRDYASHTVVITGLVSSPGMRILHREAVPLYVVLAEAQPLAQAGRALVMRASGQINVDLSDPAQMNMLVRPGDVITVAVRPPQFYYLGGKVLTPGQKPFQPGITLVQAILAAGGLERASGDAIEISREGADGRLATTRYKLKEIRAGRVPDPRLQPGDRIQVNH